MADLDSISNLSLQQKQAEIKAERALARQEAASDYFVDACTEDINPWGADPYKRQMKSLDERKKDVRAILKEMQASGSGPSVEESALNYEKKNPELPARSLQRLLQSLKDGDSEEEILKKTLEYFPDKSLADEALEFLSDNTKGALNESVVKAKTSFEGQYKREIAAGRNIATEARDFSKQGIGSTNNLRDLYRDITGNPREPNVLFGELSGSYDFEKLKTVIQFLLHAMGSDLRSKGPSIDRGELSRLFTETRTLQAILGVYRFFQSRMSLVNSLLSDNQITLPPNLTFETLAKLFMKMVEDRYPAAAKVIALANQLGLTGKQLALIIIISQWRDGIRSVSPRLYKNLKSRDDLLAAILEALDELEEGEEEETSG